MATSRRALVTGGAGFIGSHIVRALCQRGYQTRVLDDLSRGQKNRLSDLSNSVELIEGSILDDRALASAVRDIDVIFHEAAWVSVPQSVEQPLEYHDVNATGTLRVLQAARQAGVGRVVYASSSSAYGEEPEQPKRESMRALPISPYAVSKYAGELYATVFALSYGLETISLRYFNAFGPGQDPKSQYGAAIPAIVTRMLRGQSPTIFGDGEQTRDFCYIDNIVSANLLAAEADKVNGEAINIGCGRRTSVNNIVTLTNQILATDIPPTYAPSRPGDVRDSLADIALAKSTIGYSPVVHFEEGLKRSIDWYRTIEQ